MKPITSATRGQVSGIAVGRAHAAADADVVADHRAVDDAGEAQVVGEHVHVVDRRQGEADLELARQVALAVDRLVLLAAAAMRCSSSQIS
jgi:hypothetical protein